MTERPRYFLMRAVRFGPLVPARLRWLNHAPEDPPENKLDRGRLSIVVCADIAGTEVDPEPLIERGRRPASHWGALQPITETEYRYRLALIRHAEAHRPDAAVLRPRRAVDPATVPVPSFERENAL